MEIIEAIRGFDEFRHNEIPQSVKVIWLSRLDTTIKREIIDTHEGGEGIEFNGYNEDTDLSTHLLVKEPYDSMYMKWLEAQTDYCNGEIDRYNCSMTQFYSEYKAFADWYNRTHMPKSAGDFKII